MRTFFINEFVKPGLISEAMQKNNKIDIRFVFKSAEVVGSNFLTSISRSTHYFQWQLSVS
jgi:hypothetical protein